MMFISMVVIITFKCFFYSFIKKINNLNLKDLKLTSIVLPSFGRLKKGSY